MKLLGKEAYFVAEGQIEKSRIVALRLQTLTDGGEEVIAELENGLRMNAERICQSVQEVLVQLKRDFERQGVQRVAEDQA